MGLIERFFNRQATMAYERFGRPSPSSLVASAQKIDLSSQKDKDQAKKRQAKKWQKEAWDFYDQIGEIWFSMNFGGNAMKKMLMIPAMIEDINHPPKPLEPGDAWYDECTEILTRMRGDDGTLGDFLKDMYINLNVPGEGYLVVRNMDEEDESWGFYSADQIMIDMFGNFAIKESENDTTGTPLVAGRDFLTRIHRPHPRWKQEADSAMKAVLTHCDELLILSKQIRATGRSRLSAGIFLAPKEAHPPKPKQPRNTVGGGNTQEEYPFIEDFIQAMVTPVEDEASVAGVAPTIFLVPSQYLKDKLYQHITFDREMDDKAAAQRLELIQRIANGIDMPADVLLGKSNMNHWSAWQVDEDTFKSHLEPATMLMMSGLTNAIIRQFLPEAPKELVWWYDPKLVVNHPNKSDDADKAFDRYSISWEAHRKAKGFNPEDAPDEEEINKRIEIARSIRVRSEETRKGLPVDENEDDRNRDAEDPIPDESESEAEGASIRRIRAVE